MGLLFWMTTQDGMDVQRCAKKGIMKKWGFCNGTLVLGINMRRII